MKPIFIEDIIKAVKQQKPSIISFPKSGFSKAIELIGDRLLNRPSVENNTGIKSFMQKLMNVFNK